MRTAVTLCLIAVVASVCDAQWVQTNGPYGAYVSCFAVIPSGAGGTNLFAGSHGKDYWYPSPGNGGVFRSTNGAANWTAVNNGLTDLEVTAFAVSGTNLFAGTYWRGVFFPPTAVQAGLRFPLVGPITSMSSLSRMAQAAQISLPVWLAAHIFDRQRDKLDFN